MVSFPQHEVLMSPRSLSSCMPSSAISPRRGKSLSRAARPSNHARRWLVLGACPLYGSSGMCAMICLGIAKGSRIDSSPPCHGSQTSIMFSILWRSDGSTPRSSVPSTAEDDGKVPDVRGAMGLKRIMKGLHTRFPPI